MDDHHSSDRKPHRDLSSRLSGETQQRDPGERRQVSRRDPHETFLQEMVALGGAVRYFLDHAQFEAGNGQGCMEILRRADRLSEIFRNMPREKKAEFNRLFEDEL